MRTPYRLKNYIEHVVLNYTKTKFQQHFRITINAYEQLLRVVGPSLLRTADIGRYRVNVEKQLLALIWLLATSDSYRSVGERFDLAKSTLSRCVMRVPEGKHLQNIKRRFQEIARLPRVIGAVNGTYILIKAPQEDPKSYITRKCNYAFTLQAIAESFLKFTDVFIGFPGSVSNAGIFKTSDIYHSVRRNYQHYFPDDQYIIRDKAYPALRGCIPPYINRGNLTPAKNVFNTTHAKTRQVVERSFALLVGKFKRLKFLDINCNDVILATVLAACVLHNICSDFRDLNVEEYIQEGLHNIQPDADNIAQDAEIPEPMAMEGRIRRDELCRQIFAYRYGRNM